MFKKIFNKENQPLIIGISAFLFLLIMDIVSKQLVNKYLVYGKEVTVIPYIFNFIHVHNEGAAFGIGAGTGAGRIIFTIIPIIAALALSFGMFKFGKKSTLLSLALGIMIAGALGNVIDRIALGYVDDFIAFAFWDSFAIFNVADIGVTIGVVLFAIYIIFVYKDSESKTDKTKDGEEII